MQTMQVMIMMVEVLILVSAVWFFFEPFQQERAACGNICRKRINGLDVDEFDVVCVGFNVSNDRVLPAELAIMKNYLGEELRGILLCNDNREF